MSEPFAGLVGVILEAGKFIRDTLLKKRELVDQDVKELLVPIHEAFTRMHTGYLRMFNLLALEVIGVLHLPEDKQAAALQAATKAFYKARNDVEGERDLFRSNIAAMLATTSDEAWQTYLTAIATYVVTDNRSGEGRDVGTIEMLRHSLTHQSGHSVYSTPSRELQRALQEQTHPKACLDLIYGAAAHLAFKHTTVLECYYRIRLRVH